MRSKKKGIKKFLAEFLCVALIACNIPGAVFAAEGENIDKGSVTSTYETNDGISDGQKNVADTEVKDTSDTGEQNTGEGDVKDPDGKTDIGGEVSEGENEDSGTPETETKESDSEKTESGSEEDDDEGSADIAQDSAVDDGGSDGESTEDSAEDDAEDDAGSEDDNDTDTDDEEADTFDVADAEVEDEDESEVNDTAKGDSAASDDEEEEEDEDELEEDALDGPLDDDLMLLMASPSDAILPLDDPIDDVWQIEGEEETYLSFAEALDAAQDGDTIILLDDTEENITVTSGSEVILDLNDHTLSADNENNSVVTIEEGAELTLMDSGDDGCITGTESTGRGGGVYNAGIFNMDSGTITENYDNYGGGVYNTGTFNMNSGLISANYAMDFGGGVYNTGTFNMSGGTISENYLSEFMMPMEGGGVYNSGIFNMTDGEICGNEVMDRAGGVYIYTNGIFTMTGGMISGNGGGYGGGVYIESNGTFIMEDGKITENNGYEGGGVCISVNGTFTMSGGEISSNSVYSYGTYGDGVVLYSASTFNLSGSPIITDNTTSNIYLYSGAYITLAGDLKDGASIGVTPSTAPTESTPVQITTAEDGTEYYQNSAQYFFYDADDTYKGTVNNDGRYVELGKTYTASVTTDDGETYTYYDSVQAAVDALNQSSGTITMLADSTEDIDIIGNQNIILDLNGYTLTGTGNNSVINILVNCELTLIDSGEEGCITGGNSNGEGGGVFNGGTFNMNGGTISENYAINGGGGVLNYGTFTMNGGTISGNTAEAGGGVSNYANGTFTMNGGTISGNTADGSFGGGVDNVGATFNMNGGIISGNTAILDGGGVYNYAEFNMYDGIIRENFARDGAGIVTVTAFNMYGGTITGNVASRQGGGIEAFYGFAVHDGSIYGNEANTAAADIYCAGNYSLEVVAASEMEADGYTVIGWFDDSEGSRYADTDEPTECDLSTAEYHYVIAAYGSTVTYSVNGDTDVIGGSFIDVTKGKTEVTLASGDDFAVPNGYCSFNNWNTEEDGSGTVYAGGAIYSGESITLYAQFLSHEWEVVQTIIEDSEDYYEELVGIKCTRCGLEYEEEIVVSTESSGVKAHSSLSWSDLLTEDDLADLFESGAELDFKMTAAALSESDVPSADKTLAEDLIAAQWPDADYTASWLDISVLLDIIHSTGEEETREYSSTLNPVTITVAIPDELLNADGDIYAVIRIHSGEAEVLDTTDNGDGTLTFKSDLFSSYVIVKTAESDDSDGGDGGNGGSSNGGTGHHSGGSSSSSGSGVSGSGSIAYTTGTWTIDEYGYWRFTDSNGRRYENEWGYIYNPYADISAGQPSASWFHFGYDGIMDTGWFIDNNGKFYYLNPSLDNTQGAMFTGWAFIDGKWYYFDASGALLRNTQTPDGYTVDETGARI